MIAREITPQDFETAFKDLKKRMKGKKIPKDFQNALNKSLKNHTDSISIVGGKFKLSKTFYSRYTQEHNLDKENGDNHHRWFKKLRKLGMIHRRSAHFNRKLSLVSLNPTPAYLYRRTLADIDRLTEANEALSVMNDPKLKAYIDTRLFQPLAISKTDLGKIASDCIIPISDDCVLVYLESETLMAGTLPLYRLLPIFGDSARFINEYAGFIHDELDRLEDGLNIFRREHFDSLHLSAIRMSLQSWHHLQTTPLIATLMTNRSILSPLTLSEVELLFPGSVPENLMSLEHKHIEAVKHSPQREEEDEDIMALSHFTLQDFDRLDNFRKNSTTKKSKIAHMLSGVKKELHRYLENDKLNSEHGKLIIEYVLYLLGLIDNTVETERKINFSTFKDYLGKLDKHLFRNVSDLTTMQPHELQAIIDRLERMQYKGNSVKKVHWLIQDFFHLHNHSLHANYKSSSIPKSFVTTDELNLVIASIEDHTKMLSQRVGKRVELAILQLQAMTIITFYTGLRKSELGSRLTEDVYLYENTLYVDVNPNGLRKRELHLKTKNAKRRVSATIINDNHLMIVKEFLSLREVVPNMSKFLFLHIDKDFTIRSKPVKDDVFTMIGSIIQRVTGRYTSFHSLRHSYATYEVAKILEQPDHDPYRLIDLAVRMGHESPEMTLKVYTHAAMLLHIIIETYMQINKSDASLLAER